MPEYTFWLNNKETGWTFCSLGDYSQCLHMCNLHFIRKRNRASCTYAVAGPEQLQNSHFKVESTMNVFDGSFVKKMYTPYGGTHTNLAAKCKVLPKQSEYIENFYQFSTAHLPCWGTRNYHSKACFTCLWLK